MISTQLGQRLRELREFHHLTQEFISSMLNVERPSYSNYECGKRTPPLELLIQLADFYHVSMDDLLRNPDFSACTATDEFSTISKEEKLFLRLYRSLPDESKRESLSFMQFKLQTRKSPPS